jgi:hypothetical protein
MAARITLADETPELSLRVIWRYVWLQTIIGLMVAGTLGRRSGRGAGSSRQNAHHSAAGRSPHEGMTTQIRRTLFTNTLSDEATWRPRRLYRVRTNTSLPAP